MKLFSEWTSRLLGGGLIAVLVLSLGYAWCVRSAQRGAGDGTRILKLGHGLPTDHPVHEAMVMMAERVKKLSGGKLEIQIYPSGMIGSEAECLKQVQNGQLDISKTSTAVLESSVPEITVLGLPYVFRDSDHFWKVLNGPIGRDLAEHLPGMRGLVYYDAGTRNFYTTKKPVRKADDLKGLKIRTQQRDGYGQRFRRRSDSDPVGRALHRAVSGHGGRSGKQPAELRDRPPHGSVQIFHLQ